MKDFLGKILAPTGDALGQVMAHPIVEWQKSRVDRAARLLERAAQFVAESGEDAQAVPGRLLFPILERASIEENSELSERWAALLANASIDTDAVIPAFPSILGELSPDEARVLHHVYQLQAKLDSLRSTRDTQNWEHELNPDNQPIYDLSYRLGLPALIDELKLSHTDVVVTNLHRLSLIRWQSTSIMLTPFGQVFVRCCSRPRLRLNSDDTDSR